MEWSRQNMDWSLQNMKWSLQNTEWSRQNMEWSRQNMEWSRQNMERSLKNMEWSRQNMGWGRQNILGYEKHRDRVGVTVAILAHCPRHTPRNQMQETSFSVQIVPGMRFLVFDFAVYTMSVPHIGAPHGKGLER
eukprot:557708-Rhodomonas_salina.1